jgi:hypothetical protein
MLFKLDHCHSYSFSPNSNLIPFPNTDRQDCYRWKGFVADFLIHSQFANTKFPRCYRIGRKPLSERLQGAGDLGNAGSSAATFVLGFRSAAGQPPRSAPAAPR